MRQFSSLPESGQADGPFNTKWHYDLPREALVERAYLDFAAVVREQQNPADSWSEIRVTHRV